MPARFIIENALETGALKPGGLVIESSSGTFALGLAMVCANLGLQLSLVTGPLEDSVKWRLEHLGANIEIIPSAGGTLGGIQQARLNGLKQILADNPGAFWTQQYTNPLHPAAYASIGHSIGKAIGKIDFLVASVGSGGSICGMVRALRENNPELSAIAVDHNLSVLFGPTSGRAYPLCQECYVLLLGMGSDIVIPNLDHTQCDEVHWLPVAKMINAVHHIHSNYGLLLGPTAGAAYAVADWVVRMNPGKNVLTIFPDHGIRYMQTVFEPEWLNERAEELKRDWSHPTIVEDPKEVGRDWAYFPWGRRSYREVLGHDPVSR
ncbi:MAG: pyridoxal-phosphate dependent enzyme [Candidatus Parabeggiatoa sp.]|nr:pyridoxal-phosphate dependent enzyme [Candidatus Parabeggiatoa sp.]